MIIYQNLRETGQKSLLFPARNSAYKTRGTGGEIIRFEHQAWGLEPFLFRWKQFDGGDFSCRQGKHRSTM
jgi:hypothetical protein